MCGLARGALNGLKSYDHRGAQVLVRASSTLSFTLYDNRALFLLVVGDFALDTLRQHLHRRIRLIVNRSRHRFMRLWRAGKIH